MYRVNLIADHNFAYSWFPYPVEVVDTCFSKFETPDVLPIVKVGPLHVVETWRGPSGAFKDLALSVVGRLVDQFLRKRGQKANVLVGTTGDTGSAAIHSVSGSQLVSISVVFPRGKITRLQELQMTTVVKPNVRVYSAHSNTRRIDTVVKSILADEEFARQHNVIGINSINVGRILFQAAHFVYSYLQVCPNADKELLIAVPTGSMGNLTGGYLAHLLGLKVRYLAAVNANDMFHRGMTSGVFTVKELVSTYASAMDDNLPYNMERLFYFMSGGDCEVVRAVMEDLEETGSCNVPDRLLQGNKCVTTATVSNEETLSTIQQVWREFRYPLCPHSAIGVRAALDHLQSRGGSKEAEGGGQDEEAVIVIATATPAKFPEVLEKAGIPVPTHPALSGLHDKPEAKLYLEAGDDWEKVLKRDVELWSSCAQ